eukprot:4429233-Pleurochrysis_carterae.AAC.2
MHRSPTPYACTDLRRPTHAQISDAHLINSDSHARTRAHSYGASVGASAFTGPSDGPQENARNGAHTLARARVHTFASTWGQSESRPGRGFISAKCPYTPWHALAKPRQARELRTVLLVAHRKPLRVHRRRDRRVVEPQSARNTAHSELPRLVSRERGGAYALQDSSQEGKACVGVRDARTRLEKQRPL